MPGRRSAALALTLFSSVALAQAPAVEPVDPRLPPEERICEVEIAAVAGALEAVDGEVGRRQQGRLDALLDEARELCAAGDEAMAAVRLETLRALLDVTVPAG